ncbi:DUF4386 domain-containing protein [Rhodanobacter sp. T12-5]|uniref:DUF4386 domain-containing protein n=1 Tax=Rhodanobacter sp. T12-5 TaxID=2024611 RepID=UPI0011EEAD52|nr:DUF4386 domain-containing protein [Rhodanobacter sp. T12-5]KAA0068861.1 DUF4386 domain-containing protein [Rhodanobacter sp. T12-5]
MANESRIARWAGPVYLVMVVTGFFSQGCVPEKIVAPGDPRAMLANIVSHEVLFRAGAAAFMMVPLPFLLFRWLLTAHRGAAMAMVVLALVGVPVSLRAVNHRLDALRLLTHASGTSRWA